VAHEHDLLDAAAPEQVLHEQHVHQAVVGPAGLAVVQAQPAHTASNPVIKAAGRTDDCLMDVLLVQHLLGRRGVEQVVLVGHSFGGAVAIGAGALLGSALAGVVALSTQVPGTEHVDKLAGRPLLLVHGDADPVLPDLCSRNVYERAADPKELVILPGEGHLLDGAAEEVGRLVVDFVQRATGTSG
jgi:pimeloyl-ACP methyl ester carboxylesterase